MGLDGAVRRYFALIVCFCLGLAAYFQASGMTDIVSLVVAAGCAAPALAQDSVGRGAGLPGDAVGAYDPAAQKLNYVIDMAGEVYEGRGLDLVGSHCPGRNRDGFGVYLAVVGTLVEPRLFGQSRLLGLDHRTRDCVAWRVGVDGELFADPVGQGVDLGAQGAQDGDERGGGGRVDLGGLVEGAARCLAQPGVQHRGVGATAVADAAQPGPGAAACRIRQPGAG